VSAINDGGPAFPVHPNMDNAELQGMSLRDWFAGQALAGICSLSDEMGNAQWTWQAAATSAYSMADAMLATRERKEGK
jgi:hypothetical protein